MSALSDAKKRAEKATVAMQRHGGQGVVVPGGFVLTAAHCIHWTAEGYMAMDVDHIETFALGNGLLKGRVLAIEPVSDVAILGELDAQEFSKESQAYREALSGITPVPISMRDHKVCHRFAIHVLSHTKKWIAGRAELCAEGAENLAIETDDVIEGGASGGPVIASDGRLVGIVSTAQDPLGNKNCEHFSGNIPRPHLALQVWLVQQITKRRRRS